jgi:hypothetical protein
MVIQYETKIKYNFQFSIIKQRIIIEVLKLKTRTKKVHLFSLNLRAVWSFVATAPRVVEERGPLMPKKCFLV